MKKCIFGLGCALSLCVLIWSCNNTATHKSTVKRPRLVIGIVVDQMRYDYIYRFWDKFGNRGFKRLYNQGVFCTNTHYNYIPTNTGPGHASVYTGSTPAVHGIVGNDWYDRDSKKSVYCAGDKKCKTLRGDGVEDGVGQMSPKRMLTTTITDELRIATNMQSKVIGIALKDRAAILPAGHLGNAAYFFDDANGEFITSSYYKMKTLPEWVKTFNNRHLLDKYLSNTWNTIQPINTYTESIEDSNAYESPYVADGGVHFPYKLPEIRLKMGDELLRRVPWGNTYTTDFAIAAMEGEQLGKGDATDFLCVSFSSTDYIGHQFGPYSKEMEDCYIRFDAEIARLLDYIDSNIGTDNTLVFLTADHAVADVPQHLVDMNVPAGYFNGGKITDTLKKILVKAVGDTLVEAYANQQVYLRHDDKVDETTYHKAKVLIYNYLMKLKGVADVSIDPDHDYANSLLREDRCIAMGYMPNRCGDVVVKLQPGWLEYNKTGTTHSAPYNYDTHVPLFWYGYGLAPRRISSDINITDIAATLAQILKIQEPNGCSGKVIETLVK